MTYTVHELTQVIVLKQYCFIVVQSTGFYFHLYPLTWKLSILPASDSRSTLKTHTQHKSPTKYHKPQVFSQHPLNNHLPYMLLPLGHFPLSPACWNLKPKMFTVPCDHTYNPVHMTIKHYASESNLALFGTFSPLPDSISHHKEYINSIFPPKNVPSPRHHRLAYHCSPSNSEKRK